MVSHLTDVSQSTENDDVGWSSENSNTDDEDAFGDVSGPAPVSLIYNIYASYDACILTKFSNMQVIKLKILELRGSILYCLLNLMDNKVN